MMHALLYRIRLLQHYLLSVSKFDIHSPFLYKVYSEILNDKKEYAEYPRPVIGRSGMKCQLSVKDYRLLFRLARYFKPKSILMVGKEDAVSRAHLEAGSAGSRLISVRDKAGLIPDYGVFDLVILFDDHPGMAIPDYFSWIMQHIHNDSVLVFCTIHGSKEMNEVWNQIKGHSSVTLTIDLFNLGLVFCKEELTKEDFMLRY